MSSLPPLILASASPRRKEILDTLGFPYTIESTSIDEIQLEDENPQEMVIRLSGNKADVISSIYPDATVIGADTIVISPSGKILGKPGNRSEAKSMLTLLSGKTHQVCTGVTVINRNHSFFHSRTTWTSVTMRSVSDEEIDLYANDGEGLDKAGGYAIQGKASVFIKSLTGDYWNVVGLSPAVLSEILVACGYPPFQAKE